MKLELNKKYIIETYYDTFVGTYVSERDNYFVFNEIISKEDISVKKNSLFKDFNDFKNNLYSVKTDKIEAIISRKELIENYILFNPSTTVLISVNDPRNRSIDLNYFKKELYVSFYDITSNIGSYNVIESEKAKIIKDFIIENKDKKFIINCEAGKSRSAAIGLAIECLLLFNGNKYDYSIFNSKIKEFPRYIPNLAVFDKIINA